VGSVSGKPYAFQLCKLGVYVHLGEVVSRRLHILNYHLRRCELAHIVHTRRLLTLELLPLTLSPAALLLSLSLSLSHTHTHTHTHILPPFFPHQLGTAARRYWRVVSYR